MQRQQKIPQIASLYFYTNRLLSKIDELSNSVDAKFEMFVKQWFSKFDELPEDNSYFVERLSEDLALSDPNSTFNGIAGFNDWYKSLRGLFKPGVTHLIEQISLKPSCDTEYLAELRVRVQGDMSNGESINQLFNENWKVSLDETGNFQIHSYQVVAC